MKATVKKANLHSISANVRCKRKSGVECSFYNYGFRGLKALNSYYEALFAFRTQIKLSKLGLAPRVLCKKLIKVKWYNNDETMNGWAYWTQVADTRVSYRNHNELRIALVEKLKNHGHAGDVHYGNIGFITINGQKTLVLIDTGPYSQS